jgi:death-on-curing protein
MIVWIEMPLVIALHDRQIAEHGGSTGVRDESLLQSALARPQQLFAYGDPAPDLADLAASLAFGIAKNHPFVDGNKRSAHVTYRTFLALNDAELEATQEEKYLAILSLAESKMSEKEFAVWLRARIRVTTRGQVQEARAQYKASPKARSKKAKA